MDQRGALPVLLAVSGADWEMELLRRLDQARSQVRVVRRCVDVADLLAAAATGQARAALVTPGLRSLDADAVARLSRQGVVCVGLVSDGDQDDESRLRRIGIAVVLPPDVPIADLVSACVEATAQPAGTARQDVPAAPVPSGWSPSQPEGSSGRLVAVWGPAGAPGRTLVATSLAVEAAEAGVATLLADLDVYGGSLAQGLGLLDEVSGVLAAARSANNGTLDVTALVHHARQVTPMLRVLTGIPSAARWAELRPTALEKLWEVAASLAALTIVDCGFCIEHDDAAAFDSLAPRRNGATLGTLERADRVVCVGRADPVGLTRLIRAIAELRETVPGVVLDVIVNQVRAGAGASPKEISEVLARHCAIETVTFLPYDRDAVDRAAARGQTLVEAAPRSRLRAALATAAQGIVASAAGS